jgi:uncharacterized membrane protein
MRTFTFRPALTLRGREFQGPRGWAGKPLHPPLTDIPAAAYVLTVIFDAISFAAGDGGWPRELYRAGTFLLTAGAVVALLAAFTGFWDWWKSTEPGNQARRTVNAHAWTMLTVTAIVAADLLLRWTTFADEASTPAIVLVLSVAAAVLTFIGAALGGSLVFDYGFNVVTGGDHPAWHTSENDVMPGAKESDAHTTQAAQDDSRRLT